MNRDRNYFVAQWVNVLCVFGAPTPEITSAELLDYAHQAKILSFEDYLTMLHNHVNDWKSIWAGRPASLEPQFTAWQTLKTPELYQVH